MRSTTNSNARGSTKDRRVRRRWLVQEFRANVDVVEIRIAGGGTFLTEVPVGTGVAACRCYRCGVLLTESSVSPDRIQPGVDGGSYRRGNIRPACVPCQCSTGGTIGAQRLAEKRAAARS